LGKPIAHIRGLIRHGLRSQGAKFFRFSSKSLDLKEVRFFRVKLISSGMLLGVLLIAVLLAANYFFNDILGIGYNRLSVMATENRLLKEQVQTLTTKITGVQKAIDNLADRGNELRLMVDLTKLDDDTRQAAIGGSVTPQANAFLTGEAAQIISTSQNLIDRLSREIRLQQTSYEEIAKRMEYNKDFFAHIPAIKPMSGYYSINGFGMRMHPVLHVYRMHDGIDIVNDVGTPIYAAGDGVVHFAGRTAGGYGVVIEIQHGYGYSTLYAHLSQVLVRAGQQVHRGELIAKCGRSGLVSGPHLHYEVRKNGRKLNPVDFFFDDVEAARYRAALAAAQDQHHG
jgi:murein DD-endopeptidase MepM/ murein hydrolase activator NlpD